MKKITAIAAAVLLLASVATAKADTVPGWYVGAGAGASMPLESKTDVAGEQNKATFDTGWGVLGNTGYAWSNGLRLEGEVSEFRVNTDKVNDASNSTGVVNNFSFMGNAYYDFQTHTRWTPYLGVGVGVDNVDVNHIGRLRNGGDFNDSTTELGYQGIAGVSYEINDHWSAMVDYRYIASTEPNFKTTAGGRGDYQNVSNNIILGIRYTLHAPERPAPVLAEAPAPAPAPAPVPAPVPQSYMVFFDFDRSVLTPEAKQIIDSAAADYKKGSPVRIVVTGHTDTVGTAPYNIKLSERRAESVKAELVRLGVTVADIEATGVGKNGLLVPTADQIREAKNRRAEIVFSKPE